MTALFCGTGLLAQTAGCAVDPDLILTAVLQFLTDLAIFATENAAIALL